MIGPESCLLDTNIVIDLFRGRNEVADYIKRKEKAYIPIPVLGELYLGAENSKRKAHHISQIENLLTMADVLFNSLETAKIYGKTKVQLKQKGKPIPENDIWIAALAIEHSLPLITRDQHFTYISEVVVAQV